MINDHKANFHIISYSCFLSEWLMINEDMFMFDIKS